MLKEFKQFLLRGNVVDLAVGVVVAAVGLLTGLQPLTTDLYLPALPGLRADLAAPASASRCEG